MKITLNEQAGNVSGSWAYSPGDKPIPFSKTTKSLELLGYFDDASNSDFGIMPPAVRYISPSRKTAIFERPPCMQTISYMPDARQNISAEHYAVYEKEYTFTIPLPWTCYVVSFDNSFWPVDIRMYFRNAPIESLDSTVWLAPMLNFYMNGQLCPPIAETYEASGGTLGDGIAEAYNRVWNSGFNFDLKDALNQISNGTPNLIYQAQRAVSHEAKNSITRVNVSNYRATFLGWERITLSEVTTITDWPIPALDKTGRKPQDKPPRLRDILATTAMNATVHPTKEFMTKLINYLT